MRRLLILCLVFTLPLYCWWQTGHRVIARVAAAHLTPAARTRIARILNVPDNANDVADALAAASTWADETKAETKTGNWHFINLALQDAQSDIPARCPEDNCAPARIRLFAAELKSHLPDARWSELDALRYLVHLVGDIHQPLHAISDADLGGNCEQVDPPLGEAKDLHAVWDGAIIHAMNTSAKRLTASLEADIVAMTDSDRQRLSAGSQDDWVWESHQLAIENIYHQLHIPLEPVVFPTSCQHAPAEITDFKPVIDGAYIDAMKPLVRSQLTAAGLRLARLLNESL